jgi:hypothetical protein
MAKLWTDLDKKMPSCLICVWHVKLRHSTHLNSNLPNSNSPIFGCSIIPSSSPSLSPSLSRPTKHEHMQCKNNRPCAIGPPRFMASNVTCRWHVRLNVSWGRSVANSTEMMVLCSDSKPLLAESFCELTGFWYQIRRFCGDGAGEYPGRTWG